MSTRRARGLVCALLLAAGATGMPAGAGPGEGFDPGFQDGLPAGPSLTARIDEIRRRVQGAVVYPARARARGWSGVAHIRFAIGVDGHAEQVETVRSSGFRLLDRAAEQGARDAGRLPHVYGKLEVPVRFALE